MNAVATNWQEFAERALGEAGYRAGGARGAIVELLSTQTCCLSAQEISERLRGSGRNVGLASIYRALELLYGMGLVQRVEVGEGGLRYEPVLPGGDHHHHVVCDECGDVTAIDDARLEAAIEKLAGRLEHSVSAHEVVLRGACPDCIASGGEQGGSSSGRDAASGGGHR